MRLAFMDGVGFAVSPSDADAWVSCDSLGISVRTTREAIERDREIRAALESGQAEALRDGPAFRSPIVAPGKIIAIGLNYMDHVRETGGTVPPQPVVFTKFSTSVVGPTDDIELDESVTRAVDYESELAVVIGSRLKNVSADSALEGVFGYCVANDVSARDLQAEDPRITRAKSLDTFCPIGPWITSRDSVGDPQALSISSVVSGVQRQRSNTEQMIFPVASLIEHLSKGTTLEPGDVILTGTPHGVGFVMDPPVYLQPGDVVVCEIQGLGRLENSVVMASHDG